MWKEMRREKKNDHSAATVLLLLLLYCLFILTGSHCGALPGLELTSPAWPQAWGDSPASATQWPMVGIVVMHDHTHAY